MINRKQTKKKLEFSERSGEYHVETIPSSFNKQEHLLKLAKIVGTAGAIVVLKEFLEKRDATIKRKTKRRFFAKKNEFNYNEKSINQLSHVETSKQKITNQDFETKIIDNALISKNIESIFNTEHEDIQRMMEAYD